MNNYIKTRINNEIAYLNVTRDSLALEIEKIKNQNDEITGNLLLHIFIVKDIEMALDILEKAYDKIEDLSNKSDDKIISQYLDFRLLDQQPEARQWT